MNKPVLIGAWKLLAFEFRTAGGIIYPFGKEARGSIIYTENGRYSAQLMKIGRPKFKIPDQMLGATDEMIESFKGCISYFGIYEIDFENKMITHHVEGSLFPNMEGRDQKREFKLIEGCLELKTPPTRLGGREAVGVLLWRKI
jgi:hypothetical protein